MNKRMLLRPWLLVAVIAALVLSGCGAQTGSSTPAPAPGAGPADDTPSFGGKFIEVTISDPSNLNPILSADVASSEVIALVFDPLFSFDENANPVPRLAKSLEWSDDDKTLTIDLRDDVRWHDGQPFTAADVVFTVQAIMHPGYTGFVQSMFEPLLGTEAYLQQVNELNGAFNSGDIDEATFEAEAEALFQAWLDGGAVSAPDDYTVVFQLERVWAPFELDIRGFTPVPRHLLADSLGAAMKDHPFNRKPVGTGRYRFVDWQAKEAVTLTANDDWFGGRPYIDQVILKTVPDSNTLEIEMETGRAHYGQISSFDRVAKFEQLKHLDVKTFPSWTYDYVGWNLTNPLFQDKEVRQALTMAVDREAAVEALLGGHGEVAHTHGAPTRWDYNPDVPTFPYDPERAAQILADKGWTPGPDGILIKDGQRFSFSLMTNIENKRRQNFALIIQDHLKEIGIEVTTDFVDFPKVLERVQNKAGDYDAVLLGWQLTPQAHADTLFKTGASQNDGFYSNPEVDRLFDLAGTLTDRDEAKQVYGEIWSLIAEDQPYMFLAFRNIVAMYHTDVRGPVTESPLNAGHWWNMHEWWLAQ